eukprot:5472886-Pyramimonas_sp.AAC.1
MPLPPSSILQSAGSRSLARGGVCGTSHSSLLRLVPATGIFSLPFCDWCPLRIYDPTKRVGRAILTLPQQPSLAVTRTTRPRDPPTTLGLWMCEPMFHMLANTHPNLADERAKTSQLVKAFTRALPSARCKLSARCSLSPC